MSFSIVLRRTHLCLALFFVSHVLSSADNAERPNIILIMADDLGYECLGSYGGTSYRTPNLDMLAETGVRFEHCYSQPLCSPSRVQIMTGRYNFRNYSRWAFLDPRESTFANVLKETGYRTCLAGKWQLGEDAKAPRKLGFDTYCVWQLYVEGMGSRYSDPTIHIDGSRRTLPGRYGPDVFTEFICDFIEENQKEPFFVYYPMVLPHPPYRPTPDSDAKKKLEKQQLFGDMVNYIDKVVGQIVDRLDQLNLRSNTLLLFTADNGTNTDIVSRVGEQEVQGGKALLTDAGTHVPLIVNWPGTAPAGRVCDDLIDFTDFMPTLADVARAPLPAGVIVDGRSFAPQIKGRTGRPRNWIFSHYEPRFPWKDYGKTRWVRNHHWKLYDNGSFFDVRNDPQEANPVKLENLNQEALEVEKRFRKVLAAMEEE